MIVRRFHPVDMELMDLQAVQQDGEPLTAEYLEWLKDAGPAATLLKADGTVIACAGVIDLSSGGGYLWCFLSRHAGAHMMAIYRGAQRLVQVARSPVYATTPPGFAAGCRLLALLGFRVEQALPTVGHDLYVRVA